MTHLSYLLHSFGHKGAEEIAKALFKEKL